MADEEVVVNLTYDARASAQRAVDDSNKLIASLENVVKKSNDVSESLARVNTNLSGVGRLATKLENEFQPWNRAIRSVEGEYQKLKTAIEQLNRSSSRSEDQEKMLNRLISLVPQVVGRIKELQINTLEAAKAQEGLGQAYKNGYQSLDQYLNRVNQLISKFDPGTTSARQMVGEIRQLNEAFRAGVNIAGGYAGALAKITSSENQNGGGGVGRIIAQTRELTQAQRELAAQAREEVRIRNNQTNVSQNLIPSGAGVQFARDLQSQMQEQVKIAEFEKQIDREIFDSKRQRLNQEVAARKVATDLMINDLKRFQSEQIKINGERFKFQEQMATSSSVSSHAADVKRDQDALNKSVKDTADRLDYLTQKFNQDATAAKNYRATINELNEAFRKNAIGYRELGLETSKAIDVYNHSTVEGQKLAQVNKGVSSSIHEVGLNTRVAQYAMTNFSFQINDVVSGLAMGQDAMRIFAQQAGQFVQILQQIGRENIGQFFRDMGNNITGLGGAIGRWLITPVGAAVTALGTLVIGAGFVISEVLSAETRIRSFGIILRTMGTDSLVSAKALDETVRKLRDTGSAAKDAFAAVATIVRTPGINPARRDDIADTARNISAARGIPFADAASGLSNAIAGGADELTKYAQSLAVRLNPEEQKAIDRTILLRDKVEQLRITYLAIVRVMKGEFAESLTKTQELVNALSTKWNELLHALGQTSWFQTALKGLTELGDILTALTKGELKIAPMTIDLKFGSWDFGDMGKQFGEHLRSYFPSDMRTPEEKSRYSPYPSQRPGGGRGVFTTSLPGMDAGVLGEPGSVATVLPTLKSELSRYDIGGLKIDTDSLQKLAQIIAEGSKALPEGYRVRAISAYRPGATIEGTDTPSEHRFKRAIDNEIIDPQGRIVPGAMGRGGPLYQQLDKAVETAAAKLAPDIAIAIGSRFTRKPDAGHYSLGGPEAVSQAAREGRPGGLTIDTGAGKNTLTEQTRDIKDQISLLGLVNRQLVERQAIISATAEAQNKFKEATDTSEDQKAQYVLEQKNLALKQFDDQLNKNIKTEDIRIKGLQDTARATMDSSAAAVHAKAVAEADNRVRSEGIDFNVAYRQAIATTAAEAVRGAAEQVSSQVPVITGLQKQAEALKTSELAARNVRIENEANIIVQQAINAGVKEEVNILREKAKAQILAREAAQFSIETTNFVNRQTDSQQVLQLQIQMQGQTTEEINRQVTLLQAKQQIERESPGLVDSEKNARLGAVDATQRQVIALGNATREQQRLESGIRSIADTIDNTLTKSIQDAFDGNKTKSFFETIKSSLSSILSQIVNFTLIKPAIGTALGALGFGNLSQQFGTFGSSLFGGSGSNGNGGMFNQTGVGMYGSTSGSGSGGNVSIMDVAGAGKSIFDLFGSGSGSSSGGMFGGMNNFLFGGASTITDFGGGGAALGVADVLGPATAAEGLGTGGLLGGLGGLGSILPFAGAALGIGSLLFGSLFAKKPSNFASGGNLNLGSGTISAVASEGNAQNTQTSNAILKGISQFSQQLIQMTGGRLAGDLNIQAGTRDGIKIAGSIGNVGQERTGSLVGEMKFASAQEAIEAVSLALIHHVENVSETMNKVLARVTDINQLERAIQFVKTYDNLKDAFDSAFSQVEPNKIGPFEQALNEIKIRFEELTAAANEFGLSLDPINAGLKEANRRLIADFNKNISDAILGITDPIKILIQTEKDNGQARIKDAQAIGASVLEVNRLNALALDKIWESQTQNLTELADSLRTGGLSGLTIGGQLSAANDNFRQSLSLVRGGNLNEIENLASNAGNAFSLSQQAYGNAPQTARLREEILSSIDGILSKRSFAEGTNFTPSGWIRVGENGPEWFNQSGGNKVLPSGQSPPGFGEMVSELRMLRNEVQMLREENTRVMVGVGQDTGERLEKVRGELRKKPLVENVRARA